MLISNIWPLRGIPFDIKSIWEDESFRYFTSDPVFYDILQGILDNFTTYRYHRKNVSTAIKFDVSAFSGGFVASSFAHNVTPVEATYMLSYFSLVLKQHSYINNLLEEKTNADHSITYTAYQKPSIRLPHIDGKAQQLYGNIHIDTTCLNKEVQSFKLIAHRYCDSKFSDGYPFDDLIQLLCTFRPHF